jgi:hypothetical protein
VTVTFWVIVGAALGAAALAAIGYFTFSVFLALKGLSKEIGRAGRALAEAAAPIQGVPARSADAAIVGPRSSSATVDNPRDRLKP